MPSRPVPSRRLGALACVFAVAALALPRAEVGTAPAREWITDAPVDAAASLGDVAYLGGRFNYIGLMTADGPSFVDRASGALASGCATRTGSQAGPRPVVVPDPTGGLFMQVPLADDQLLDGVGPFPVPSGESFVRIGEDCRFERGFRLGTFVPGDTVTRGLTITRAGDVIYVGGTRAIGFGDSFGRVAAYNGTSGARLNAWDYAQFSVVLIEGVTPAGQLVVTTARAEDDTTREVGILQPSTGLFTQLAVIESVGSYVAVFGGTLFVLPAANRPLQAFDLATGQSRAGWSNPVLTVTDLETADGRLFVAGSGLGRSGVLALTADTGALIPGFAPELGAAAGATLGIERLALIGPRLFVRGRTLRTVEGESRYLLAALNATTGAAETWAPVVFAPTADAIDLVPLGPRLFVGRVAAPLLERRTHLAAVSTETGVVLPFDPNGAPGAAVVPPVTALAANDSHLFAGASQGQIRRVALATGGLEPWAVTVAASGATAGVVAALLLDDTTLYVGGHFSTARTSTQPIAVARAHLLAVNVATAELLPWDPLVTTTATDVSNPRHPVTSLTASGEWVAVGGNFTAIGGQARAGLAMVDGVSGAPLLPTITLADGETVLDTDQDDTETFFVGLDAADAPFIGVADSGSSVVSRWTVGSDPATWPSTAIAWSGGVVYSGVEWDIETGAPREASATWVRPVAVEAGLLELADFTDGGDGPVTTRLHEASGGNALTSPRDLTVQYSGTEVYLSWRAPVRGAVDSYIIRAGAVTGETTLANFDTGSSATVFHALAPEGVYYVRVHARHGAAITGPSNEVAFALVPFGCNTSPRAPGTLSGVASADGISLAWGPAINASSYVIEAGSATGLADIAVVGVGQALTLQTAAPAQRYFIRARGANSCGRGPASNEIDLTVGGPPPLSPANLRARVSGSTVGLEWDAPTTGAVPTFYHVEAGSGPGMSDLATTRTSERALVATGVPAGRYFVRVRAGNASGLSAPTADRQVDVHP